MKRTLLLSGLLFAFFPLFAQWQYVSGSSGPIVYNGGFVGIGTSSPANSLDVMGLIQSHSGLLIHTAPNNLWSNNIGVYLQGPTTGTTSANLLMQANNGSGIAFWLTAQQGYLTIGGSGGSEVSKGPINIDGSGNIGINTLNTSGYLFNCAGTAVFDQVTVKNFSGNNPKATPWADYVFQPSYRLRPIDSLDAYIKTNNHLPGIPTSADVQQNGIDLAANQAKLLEKIEELTLYTIELQKQSIELQKQVDALKAGNEKLAGIVESLTRPSR